MSKAVLLLQMVGPETLKDVEPFLYNLFNDPFIIQLPSFIKPFQSTLARFISSRRTPDPNPIIPRPKISVKARDKKSGSDTL